MSSGMLTDRLQETLVLFDEGAEPLTTTEVADSLNVGRRSTYERLETLVEHDRLRTKKVGANARVWWQPVTQPSANMPDWSAAADSLVGDVLDNVAVSIFVLDENFEVAWINEATERYFGLDRDGVLGRDKRTLVDERIAPIVEDSDAFADTVLATYDDNTYMERFECQVTAGDDREERWLEHRSKPIEAGAYAGGRVELYYDITDRKRSERARREDRQEFASLVNAVDEYAIFTLDPDGHVRTWNPGAERIKGYEADDILGEHFSQFYTNEDREANVPQENLAAAAEHGSTQDESWRVRKDGSRFWANVTITAIRDNDGDLQGYAKIIRDMTERRERERQLRRERDLTQQLLDVAPVQLAVFQADGSVERMSAQAKQGLGIDEATLSEFDFTDLDIFDAGGNPISADEHPVTQVLETGERVSDRLVQHDAPDGRRWVSLTAAPLFDEDGSVERVVVAGKDVTDLKQTERRLERRRKELEAELDDIFARIEDAFYALDEEMRFEYVNDRAEELLSHSKGELLGRTVWNALSVADDDPIREQFETALATQEPTTFERYSEPQDMWEIVSVYPSESGLSVYFTDITDRKKRERELEKSRNRYQTLIENFPNGAVALVDEDFRYITFGGTPEGDTDATRENLEGQPVREALPEQIAEVVVPRYETALDGEPSEFVDTIDGRVYQFHFVPVRDDHGDIFAAAAMSQDITERRERERQLRSRVRQQEVVTALGQRALEDRDLDALMADAAELVADTLDNDYCKVLDLDTEAEELLLRQGVGWHDGIVGKATVSATENDSQAAYTLATEGPVVVEDLASESRFTGPDLLKDHDVRSGISTIIGSPDDPWGILGTHDRDRKEFSENDAIFVQAIANILASAIDRHEYEQKMVQHREQLAALNNINQIVQEITGAIIEQSTREEIEQIVCERLADSDSYEFAWVCEVDSATGSITPRVEAGVEGYVESISLSIDPDDPSGQGPTGTAIRTQEIQVANAFEDSEFEPWRDYAEEYGYQSSAAIPIVHEETLYGVLNVYADRPHAFDGQEGAVIGQLGEVVGHAIAAADRKQALLSDELVELDFRIQDVFAALDAPVETSGTITLDHVVPAKDGEFLVYGTASEDALDTVHGLVEVLPHWESVSVISDDDPVTFELRLIDPPVLSVVASHGGYIDEAVIEDGDYQMTIHLAPTTDVRTITDAVEEAYPQVELLRRHQISRPSDESIQLQGSFASDLTDRQHSALEAAYHAGFFKWPRETTGEQIAESLGISPPTFHQHLRKAQQKAFGLLLSASTPVQEKKMNR